MEIPFSVRDVRGLDPGKLRGIQMKLALFVSTLVACSSLAIHAPAAEANPQVKALQKELIQTLKDVAESTTEQVRGARSAPLEAIEAQRSYLEAVADAAETPEEKIKAHTQLVDVARQMEQVAIASFESARSTYADVLRTKASRIKAEIVLAEAEAALLAIGERDQARPKLQLLQKERIDSLRKVVEVSTALVKNARLSPAEALQAQQELLKAELDAAENRTARIEILRQFVDLQSKMEENAKELQSSGRGTEIQVLKARASRVKTQIALEKELAAEAAN